MAKLFQFSAFNRKVGALLLLRCHSISFASLDDVGAAAAAVTSAVFPIHPSIHSFIRWSSIILSSCHDYSFPFDFDSYDLLSVCVCVCAHAIHLLGVFSFLFALRCAGIKCEIYVDFWIIIFFPCDFLWVHVFAFFVISSPSYTVSFARLSVCAYT